MSGIYFHPIKRVFLNLSGGTVTGDTIFTQGLSADTFSILSNPLTANTAQSILVRESDGRISVREASTLISSAITSQDLQSVMSFGSTSSTASNVLIKTSGGTDIAFKSDTASLIIGASISASSLSMLGDITPVTDNMHDIGTPTKRFRSLNTVNGIAVSFSASSLSMLGHITPDTTDVYDIGTPTQRFRSLNTVDGVAVNFTASTSVKTAQIELGNTLVTQYNIILSGNCIDGGAW